MIFTNLSKWSLAQRSEEVMEGLLVYSWTEPPGMAHLQWCCTAEKSGKSTAHWRKVEKVLHSGKYRKKVVHSEEKWEKVLHSGKKWTQVLHRQEKWKKARHNEEKWKTSTALRRKVEKSTAQWRKVGKFHWNGTFALALESLLTTQPASPPAEIMIFAKSFSSTSGYCLCCWTLTWGKKLCCKSSRLNHHHEEEQQSDS